MAIPDEDGGPSWLRDFRVSDFGDIAADVAAMEEFAAKLAAEVEHGYAPHLMGVTDAMLTRLPPPPPSFSELIGFMRTHVEAQEATRNNVYNFANGTNHLATAAQKISNRYRGADAFAHAKLADVSAAFGDVKTPGSTGGAPAGDA